MLLFSKPFNLLHVLPWVVIAIAVVVIVGILAKSISSYRNIKRNRNNVKSDSEPKAQLIAIRGEYFVLSCNGQYSVGVGGQLKAGKYFLRGDGYDKFQLTVNGEVKEFVGDSEVDFSDGDTVTSVTCDLLIKPVIDTKGE